MGAEERAYKIKIMDKYEKRIPLLIGKKVQVGVFDVYDKEGRIYRSILEKNDARPEIRESDIGTIIEARWDGSKYNYSIEEKV